MLKNIRQELAYNLDSPWKNPATPFTVLIAKLAGPLFLEEVSSSNLFAFY